MQLPVCEYAAVQVLLGPDTQLPIFIQHLAIKRIYVFELLIGSVFVSIYLIFDLACGRGYWDHSLDVEEFVPIEY